MRNMETVINGLVQGMHSVDQKIGQIVQFIQNLQQAIRLDSTGKEMRLLAIQKLLIKKNHITEAEMTEAVGEVIKEMQKEAEEQAKKEKTSEIVVPTTEQVQQVAATTTPEAIPPQA